MTEKPVNDAGRGVVRSRYAGMPAAVAVDGLFQCGRYSVAADEVERILDSYLSEQRRDRIESVIDGRTRSVATVVEGLANLGNVSAVMRSAEAFGFQPFHIIHGDVKYKLSERTSQGADKWLDIALWQRPEPCVAALKAAGYDVVATCLRDDAERIDDLDFSRRTALVFGNEADGISDATLALADRWMVVPTSGFVESLNISVAAAVCLYHAHAARKRLLGRSGDLTAAERTILRASFYIRAVQHAERLIEESIGRQRDGG